MQTKKNTTTAIETLSNMLVQAQSLVGTQQVVMAISPRVYPLLEKQANYNNRLSGSLWILLTQITNLLQVNQTRVQIPIEMVRTKTRKEKIEMLVKAGLIRFTNKEERWIVINTKLIAITVDTL